MTDDVRFKKWCPVQAEDVAAIPRALAERAWAVYDRAGHGDQSLDRICERGGFGLVEVLSLLAQEHDPNPRSANASQDWPRRKWR